MVTLANVTSRLIQLGYPPKDEDNLMIQFELDLIKNYVINYCNFIDEKEIPIVCEKRIIDRVCSEYLLKKKNAGQLEGFNYDYLIKSVKEGDTQINYLEGETPETRFDDLVNYLQRGFDKWISPWRKLKW